MHIPGATYRIQFNHLFGFEAARKIVPYLSELGVTDLYASPVFKAVKGSMHGYDVTDPSALNPEIGTEEEFEALSAELSSRGLFWLQDIVPNHMAYSSENRLLMDLMENGDRSRFHGFFDVEWDHPHASARQRILAPFLGSFYWTAVEDDTIRIEYSGDGFAIRFYDERYPLRIESYIDLLGYNLEWLKNRLGRNAQDYIKYLGVLYVIRALSPSLTPEEWADQVRFVKDLVREMYDGNQEIKDFIDGNVKVFNAERELIGNYELLDRLLGEQHYRLAFWKVANEEINYRRFFNISSLIGVRMENEEAFNRMHSFIVKLVKEGKVHGLRIDHVDGLYDPAGYLTRLRDRTKCCIVVEKILESGEELPEDWPVEGTTGYEFAVNLTGVMCRKENEARFSEIYAAFTGLSTPFEELVTEKKRLIIHTRMAGEVERLAFLLEGVSSRDRLGIDITMVGIKLALEALLTHFPVYRTYVNGDVLSERDRKIFETAIEAAVRHNPRIANELRYIGNILLGLREEVDPALRERFIGFVMRLQQLTGPVMAKGFEDTSLYVYNRLLSLNEVGGNPGVFGITAGEFHAWNRIRRDRLPHSLNATYTHDTKRSEDVRARINVLSEIPDEWERFLEAMGGEAAKFRTKRDRTMIPDRNDEYFLYQTILGSYPFNERELPSYVERLRVVIVKAVREASVHTEWIKPDEEYENGYLSFMERILSPENTEIQTILRPFAERVGFYGIWNSLSQVLLKAAAPGVPDFYQGSELWDFSLVDPDNRRPVEFELRTRLLDEMKNLPDAALPEYIRSLYREPRDGRLKLLATHRALRARAAYREAFENGDYTPVETGGAYAEHIIAFTREADGAVIAAAAPRFLTRLTEPGEPPVGPAVWEDTSLALPPHVKRWKNLITGERLSGGGPVSAGELFAAFPGTLLAAD